MTRNVETRVGDPGMESHGLPPRVLSGPGSDPVSAHIADRAFPVRVRGLARKSLATFTYLGKLRATSRPSRGTGPLLDISECLLRAHTRGGAMHGWALMKQTKRSGPAVYRVLDQMEDRGLITGYWEKQGTEDNRPRLRFYQLTSEGKRRVEELLGQRRPHVLRNLRREPVGGVIPGMAPDGAI
jgi:PadR family transcriptional regulator, regulatory protein PadR